MLTVALLVIAKNWNQARFPSTGEWLNKLWYIHTMKYYSAIKSNKLTPTTSINLQGIMLSDKSRF